MVATSPLPSPDPESTEPIGGSPDIAEIIKLERKDQTPDQQLLLALYNILHEAPNADFKDSVILKYGDEHLAAGNLEWAKAFYALFYLRTNIPSGVLAKLAAFYKSIGDQDKERTYAQRIPEAERREREAKMPVMIVENTAAEEAAILLDTRGETYKSPME